MTHVHPDHDAHVAERERHNAAIKRRFALGLDAHLRECPICILRGPDRGCQIGRLLLACARHGLDTPRRKEQGR